MEMNMKKIDDHCREIQNWMVLGVGCLVDPILKDSLSNESSSSSWSLLEDSTHSISSFSSLEWVEDAPSSSASSSTSLSHGPLYELSELMATLPIKRGLSNFYQGKTQSFTSLSSAKSLEDLPKKGSYRRRTKSCKSYGGELEGHHSNRSYQPKATISKTKASSRGSFMSILTADSKRRPSIMVQKNFV